MVKSLLSSNDWFSLEAFNARVEQSVFDNGTFYDVLYEYMEKHGLINLSYSELISLTYLSSQICCSMMSIHRDSKKENTDNDEDKNTDKNKDKKEYHPSMKTILAWCIGLKYPEAKIYQLLELAGYALSPSKRVHRAYRDLLHVFDTHNLSVRDCNNHLRKWEIDEKHFLGSFGPDEVM